MPRVIVLVLDSFGIGASHDASRYGDAGADTFGHIVSQTQLSDFALPNLTQLGLTLAHLASTGQRWPALSYPETPVASYGFMQELSLGKDTPSGHWEMMGVPVLFTWGYFPETVPCFPEAFTNRLIQEGQLPGILGNCHASGTEIIAQLGAEHCRTGKPIIYTSADSVCQIAAHEEQFGLAKLYTLCEQAFEFIKPHQIARVIARPFIGEPGNYQRTANRRDYAVPPPKPTLLEHLQAAQIPVIGIGKIADIFAHRGITQVIKGDNNADLFAKTLAQVKQAGAFDFIFTNFVDFDSQYGHRRDIDGYARALMAFDAELPALLALLKEDDWLFITADHGCDPSFPGSDHTREHVPLLAYTAKQAGRFLGKRDSFADLGQSIASLYQIPALDCGIDALSEQPS